MKLTILGSGLFIPQPNRISAGYLLQIGGKNIIIDMGAGVYHQLERAGISFRDIDYIFITHIHIDHIADILPFLWGKFGDWQDNNVKKKVRIFGPPGFKKFMREWLKPFYMKKVVSGMAEIIDIKSGTKRYNFGKVEAAEVKHNPHFKSLAYRFEKKSKSVVFSGDLEPCDSFRKLSEDADVLILEASALKPGEGGHFTLEEAGELAKEAKVKKLVMTHIDYRLWKKDVRGIIKKNFKGPLVIGKDLMKFKI